MDVTTEAAVESIFTLLMKCHTSLRIRESNLYCSMQLLHNMLHKLDPVDNKEMPRILCALLFIVQKYEPTDRQVYSSQQIITRLFGDKTQVLPQHIVWYEEFVLDILEFRVETVTPYHFVHIFGDSLGFKPEQMNLLLYLITLGMLQPKMQDYHPANIAAAGCLLVLQSYQMPWTPSMTFWSSFKATHIEEERDQLLELWTQTW